MLDFYLHATVESAIIFFFFFKLTCVYRWFSSFSILKHKNQYEHEKLLLRVWLLIYTGVNKLTKNRGFIWSAYLEIVANFFFHH